jgi:hypothetical protein
MSYDFRYRDGGSQSHYFELMKKYFMARAG